MMRSSESILLTRNNYTLSIYRCVNVYRLNRKGMKDDITLSDLRDVIEVTYSAVYVCFLPRAQIPFQTYKTKNRL
jgi:hypothetical protein